VPGFAVAASAGTGTEALRLAGVERIDLVLLDMNLPDLHGLDVCRSIRAAGRRVDVIAVTSARELDLVRAAVSLGVVQYVLKPFVFASLRDRLVRYAEYRAEVMRSDHASGQDEVDRLMAAARTPSADRLPKGMSRPSLESVIGALRVAGQPLSAAEVAERVGMSRVSARRYLEHLSDRGLAGRNTRYGRTGRPEIEYDWRS